MDPYNMQKKSNVLDKIVATKRQEVAMGQQQQSFDDFRKIIDQQMPCRGFIRAIEAKQKQNLPAVIAEVKKASPSKGVIREDFNPVEIAQSYLQGGASCLSVLTDQQYFKGSDEYLIQVRDAVNLPVLRKDFMIDPWQIYQSKAMGADCVLLIVACLDDDSLSTLYNLAVRLGMDVLMEVHDLGELHRALATPAQLIGINNRNLKTFETSLETSQNLKHVIDNHPGQKRIVVSESGIHRSADIEFLEDLDIHTFLIGESFMRHANPGEQLQKLMRGEA